MARTEVQILSGDSGCQSVVNETAEELFIGVDNERSVIRAVGKGATVGSGELLRCDISIGRSPVGETRPEDIPGSV